MPGRSTNPCGEIDLGGFEPMDQYVAGNCTMHFTMTKTKVYPEIAQVFAGPFRSVWWWLRNPIV